MFLPFEGPVCKHIIAMCHAILAGDGADKRPEGKEDKTGEMLSQIISSMDIDEMKNAIMGFLRENPQQKDAFVLRNLSKLEVNHREVIAGICSNAADNEELYGNCQELLESVENLLKKGETSEAWEICRSLIETALPAIQLLEEDPDEEDEYRYDYEEEEPEYYYDTLCTEVESGCIKVMEQADDALKQEIFAWAVNYLEESNNELIPVVLDLAEQSILDPTMGEAFLACLDGMSNTEEYWSPAQITLSLSHKISYLKSSGQNEEVWQLLEKHQDIHEFQMLLINLYIEAGKLGQAEDICKKYLLACSNKWLERMDFIQLMIKISELRNDLDTRIHYLQELYFLDRKKLEHYQALKAICPPEAWPKIKEQIETALRADPHYDQKLAEIYAENEEYDRMLDLITRQKELTDLYLRYGKYAAKADMARFIANYQDLICHQLRFTGRSIYENVTDHLRNLLFISQDANLVKDLISRLKKQYNNRRSMIEIFDREFSRLH
jgi:hypothetical protein